MEQNSLFKIILLNKISEEDEEESWSFSYQYYSFNCSETENGNIVHVFNNFGKKIKTFTNVLIFS